MKAQTVEGTRFRQSLIRTHYFRAIFVLAVAAFAALFIGFYKLVFSAIGDALAVQSSFFVERVRHNVETGYQRVYRETSTLLVNRAVVRYLSAAESPKGRQRVDDFISWWLGEVDNPAYAALTYLDAGGQVVALYPAQKYLDGPAGASREQSNQKLSVTAMQATESAASGATLASMVRRSWAELGPPNGADAYTLALPDSTLLLRTVRPILARRSGATLGFLGVDLHFEHIFGAMESDRKLLVSQRASGAIIFDALAAAHRRKDIAAVYPTLGRALSESARAESLKVEFHHEEADYSAYAVDLEDPPWTLTALVDKTSYVGGASSTGLVLIVTALLFVAIAGASIIILSRRVEERTEKLAAARDRLEEELHAAHELQMGLMPRQAPSIAGLDIAGKCQPAAQVGGDFFQYFELEGKRLAIAMADVTGHGMRAAVPTMVFSGLLTNQISYSHTVEDLFLQLNRSLLTTLEKRTFICFALGEMDLDSNVIRLANSGCPYPYFYRARDNTLEEVTMGALPLGLRKDPDYPVQELAMAPGDRIILCSDGIIEASNTGGELFGFERLAELLKTGCERGLGAQDLIDFVFAAVGNYCRDVEQEDDQTMVVLSLAPPPA